MLPILVVYRNVLLFRGLIALAFAVVVLLPGVVPPALVLLFGVYTLLDSIAALSVALASRVRVGYGSLVLEGVVRAIGGAVACLAPGMTANQLIILVAVWAVVSGVAELGAAAALRNEVSGEWPLPIAGVLSLTLGAAVMATHNAGLPFLKWILSAYGFSFGIPFVVLALRLRQLAREMGA